MSGDGIFMLLAAPIVIGGAALAGVGLAGYAGIRVIAKAGSAAWKYHQDKKNRQDQIIKDSGLYQKLEGMDSELADMMEQLDAEGEKLFASLEEDQKRSIEALVEKVKAADAQGFEQFVNGFQEMQKEMLSEIDRKQIAFEKEYDQKLRVHIRKSEENLKKKSEAIYEKLKRLDGAEKENKIRTEAEKELKKAKQLLDVLQKTFDMEKLNAELRDNLVAQFQDIREQYDNHLYQAALAGAYALEEELNESFYNFKFADMDWDHAYQLALNSVEMIRDYLEAQEYFSEEAAVYAREEMGFEIPEEILGEAIGDYAERTEAGKNRYEEARVQNAALFEKLMDPEQARCYSAESLRKLANYMMTNGMTNAVNLVNQAVLNMSNSAYRVEEANRFGVFLKQKGYLVRRYYVDKEDCTSTVEIMVKNPHYNELVVYSLEKQKPGGNPAEVNFGFHMIGKVSEDGTTIPVGEDRNQYYQSLLGEYRGKPAPMHCSGVVGGTSRQLSEETKKQLKQMGVHV